jgi:hypothetical protein
MYITTMYITTMYITSLYITTMFITTLYITTMRVHMLWGQFFKRELGRTFATTGARYLFFP